jgi:hypothetical protein
VPNKELFNIKNRLNLEKSLAEALSSALGKDIPCEKLIIDIPEPISFESDLYIVDEKCFFPESSSAFKSEMIRALKKSLQKIHIFMDGQLLPNQEKFASIVGEKGKDILQITQKQLQLI